MDRVYSGNHRGPDSRMRGQMGVYDANHPDDRLENHFPLVLRAEGKLVGVVRVDLDDDENTAYFRRVAIAEDAQGKGLGTRLMQLAEHFASGKGFSRFAANVAKDAIPFYQKLGYNFVDEKNCYNEDNPLMFKELSGN